MTGGFAPSTLAEALELRATRKLTPYAGGTDLMIAEERKGDYLFLNKIEELSQIGEDADNLYIGATCTYTQLLKDPRTPALLKEAIAQIAAPAIRNTATIGGNIANASPKADSALICFVTDSQIKLASSSSERIIPIKKLYLGRGRTDIREDELITEIIMPKKWLNAWYYQKVGARKALAISRISFAGLLTIKENRIAHLACAFGAVSDVIIRRDDIDSILIGKTPEEASAQKEEFLKAYNEAIVPIRGRVSAEYRKKVCMNLLENFLTERI
jgi:CO/xanthine dehydrogenase FAD-binding subunit